MTVAASLRVLVVDDQLTMRALVQSSLLQLGVKDITLAADGEEGLRHLLQKPVDLVISDFNMPKLDGLSLLRAIRSHEPTSKVAFIMLTGRADKDLVQKAVKYGVNNYVAKPFTAATLRSRIEAVFGALT